MKSGVAEVWLREVGHKGFTPPTGVKRIRLLQLRLIAEELPVVHSVYISAGIARVRRLTSSLFLQEHIERLLRASQHHL
jgi:hypothetical protein